MARRGRLLCGVVLATVGLAAPLSCSSSSAAATQKPAVPCHLSAKLVPSCGVMLGAYPTSFGGSTVDAAFHRFNKMSGTQLSVDHDYRTPGQTLSPADVTLAETPGALLLVNWKPATNWSLAGGGNASVNAQIDAMARSVKALGNHTIMMTVFHEAEISVTNGAIGCPSTVYKGHSGTPAEYRAMWANVESRFAALGVTNVVWSMDYVGYDRWNCMIDDLWPGNSLVDWVLFDPYRTNNRSYSVSAGAFYDTLTSLSDGSHNYLSKPWGLGELGDINDSDAVQNTFYSTIIHSLKINEFPKLKLICFYDSVGNLGDSRVAYDESGNYDPKELANFDKLGRSPQIVLGRQSVDAG
jgi:hypothetical protein